MGILKIPEPVTGRPQNGAFGTQPAYTHHKDSQPSLSWGFLLYAVRWHMHRMRQGEMARLLGTKQEYISRWELGKVPVPQMVRTWLVTVILARLEDGVELPLPKDGPHLSRVERQRHLMDEYRNFGGKGVKRRKAA